MPGPSVRRRRERELRALRFALLRRLPLLILTASLGVSFGASMTLTGLANGRMLAVVFGLGWLLIAAVFCWSLLRDLAADLRRRRRLRRSREHVPEVGSLGSAEVLPLEAEPSAR
jgi:predicted permease